MANRQVARADSSDDAARPMHPALKNVVVFVVGALFGAVAVFFYVTGRIPAALPPAAAPQTSTTSAPEQNPAPSTSPPPAAIAPAVEPPPPAPAAVNEAATSSTTAPGVPDVPPATTAAQPTPGDQPTAALLIPVAGIQASQLTDTYSDARSGGRVHDAIDIMAPKGTQVIAADDGRVAKLFYSKQGGLTVYQFDPTEKFAYYYAHLHSYAPGLVEGAQLHRGDPIGQVGFSGNASEAAPHLHFAIFVLGPEKHWWQGTAINPYPLLSRR